VSDSPQPPPLGSLSGGGVSERPKERASKAREGQPSAGSNPAATASLSRPNASPPQRGPERFWLWSQMWSQLVPLDASLLEHKRPSRRRARSLWIGVMTCV
jgi:type VI protein secretion system component VasK